MTSLRLIFTASLAIFVGAQLWTDRSRAQNAGPWPGTSFHSVSPGPGATDVALNTSILVRYNVGGGCPLTESVEDTPVLRPVGASDPSENIATSVELVSETLYVVTPSSPLASSTQYEIVGVEANGEYTDFLDCDTRTTGVLGTFTTGSSTDLEAPSLEAATWTCLEGQYLDGGVGFAANGIAQLNITSSGNPAAEVVSYDVYSAPESATASIVRWPGGPVPIPLTGEPDHRFGVEAVDLAGNRSARLLTAAAPVVCPTPSSSGCTVGMGSSADGRASGIYLLAALGLLLRRRQRSRNGRLLESS